jgi:cAMP-specific phosphodiesterase 4
VNIQNIHENRRNQYLSNLENPQFEIFLKVVDNDFKGFTVIFHENEARRLKQYFMALKIDNMTNDV